MHDTNVPNLQFLGIDLDAIRLEQDPHSIKLRFRKIFYYYIQMNKIGIPEVMRKAGSRKTYVQDS
jgi:hypothetical protein